MEGEVRYLKEAREVASVTPTRAVRDSVEDIIDRVRENGDDGVRACTREFDDVDREQLRVTPEEIEAAGQTLDDADRRAIDATIQRVRSFHRAQRQSLDGFERAFDDGVVLGTRLVPVEHVGVYVPGGRKPLVAAPAMTIVPAVVAGVDRVIACAPPQRDGTPHPAQLYAMDQAGADAVYVAGGAQAIAAMAHGTETIPAVDLITGPGNVFVTEAKRAVYGRVGIDFLAGPTEVLIVADATADPALVATDLLAQAEHDPDARAILVTTDESLAEAAMTELEAQLPDLATEEVARASWSEHGEVIVAPDRTTAAALVNDYAPEHVQLMVSDPRALFDELSNFGSAFLGHHAPVVFGDKAIGTNHTLPTRRVARYTGGISVLTYLKACTYQEVSAAGADAIAPWAAKICQLEGTHAHQLSAEARIASETARDLAADLGLDAD